MYNHKNNSSYDSKGLPYYVLLTMIQGSRRYPVGQAISCGLRLRRFDFLADFSAKPSALLCKPITKGETNLWCLDSLYRKHSHFNSVAGVGDCVNESWHYRLSILSSKSK